jgi:hypothetical protein
MYTEEKTVSAATRRRSMSFHATPSAPTWQITSPTAPSAPAESTSEASDRR